jgi:hypothetical protein
MSDSAGTMIAFLGGGGLNLKMGRKARVSAVFLLVSAIWVGVVRGDVTDRRGASAQVPGSRSVGVGTKSGTVGEKVQGVAGRQNVVGARPRVIFGEVEKGWRNGTPKPFERYLGKGKVRLHFGEGGPRDGLYTADQAYYLITEYLKRAPTLTIRFLKVSDDSEQGTRPYALLERTCRYRTGLSRTEVIFVSLMLEAGRWVISELKVVPAL